MSRKLFTALLLTILITGCNGVSHYEVDSFVLAYEFYTGINLSNKGGDEGCDIYIQPEYSKTKRFVEFRSKGEDKRIYDSLCVANGDYNHRHKVSLLMDDVFIEGAPSSFSPNITSLEVLSNQDFDEQHPSGTSLNDLIEYSFRSFGRYVNSGYQEKYFSDTYTNRTKLLKDISTENFALISYGRNGELGKIHFIKSPDNSAVIHKITVKLTTENADIFSASIDCNFID